MHEIWCFSACTMRVQGFQATLEFNADPDKELIIFCLFKENTKMSCCPNFPLTLIPFWWFITKITIFACVTLAFNMNHLIKISRLLLGRRRIRGTLFSLTPLWKTPSFYPLCVWSKINNWLLNMIWESVNSFLLSVLKQWKENQNWIKKSKLFRKVCGVREDVRKSSGNGRPPPGRW